MRAFNSEEAKNGVPIFTRSGKKARIICYDRKSFSDCSLIALIEINQNYERIKSYHSDGRHFYDRDSEIDLVMLDNTVNGPGIQGIVSELKAMYSDFEIINNTDGITIKNK